jgi:Leucine rich repeat
MLNFQQWLETKEELNNKEKRSLITELELSGCIHNTSQKKDNWEKLSGRLDLSDFINLEILNCSFNEITFLNLSNCPKLKQLECRDNELTEIQFPNSLQELEILKAWNNNLTEIDWDIFSNSLSYISISNNDLKERDIEVFHKFTNLKELYLGTDVIDRLEQRKYNRFLGSLKLLLEKCKQLEKLQIENSGIDEDLKHLPQDLQIISWHKQNDNIARIIPLERLYVIGNNLSRFIYKWGKGKEKNDSNIKIVELSKLENPDSFNRQRQLVTGIKWTNRATSVIGGSLLLVGANQGNFRYNEIGGVIAIIAPFIETLTSYIDDKIYSIKQRNWDDFLTDSQTFLYNYNELLGILSQFENSKKLLGSVNIALKDLNEKLKRFLEIYDSNQDHEIQISELVIKRNILSEDLAKEDNSNLQSIINSIKALERNIIKYRKFSYYEGATFSREDSTLGKVLETSDDKLNENVSLIRQVESLS